jgi:ABC-type amino acid transport substrate-binding protein
MTSVRREIAGFSNGIFDNSLRIIVRKELADDLDLLSYLKPFSVGLWMMLLGACMFAAVLFCLIERQKNDALHNRSIASSIAMSLWYSIGTIMGYGADFHAATAAGRLITVSLYMLSLVFVATYTANLASDLTVSKSKNIISSIDDIKSGKIPFSRFGIRVGTASEELYLREISGGNRNFYPLTTRKDMYEKLLAKIIDASLMDTGIAEYITNNVYCNLTLVGADFDKSTFGIVTPKLYAQELDVNILALRETGVLDELKRKWFQSKICSGAVEEPIGIRLETMSGLFLTFAVICLLSLFFMVCEKRYEIKTYFVKLARREIVNDPPTPKLDKGRIAVF